MSKNKNTIKINGHLYDAVTGDRIDGASKPVTHQSVKSVDGVVAPQVIHPSKPKPSAPPRPVTHAPAATSKPSLGHRQPHHVATAVKHHAPQHSKTLMRHVVKKPSTTKHLKAQGSIAVSAKSSHQITAKSSAHVISDQRLHHAKRVSKSTHISRYGATVASAENRHPSSPKPGAIKVQPVAHHAAPKQSAHAELMEQAIKRATSHHQPKHRKPLSRRQQIAGYSALVVVSVAFLGILVTQSSAGIQLRVAANKAGFAASAPAYKPAGFRMDDMYYSAGQVAMHFKSNSDQVRSYSITQKTSSWDSSTLRDTFVAPADRNFKVVSDSGLNVFVYGDGNATWVNDGVWYQVQANSTLSDRQLVDIAKSL